MTHAAHCPTCRAAGRVFGTALWIVATVMRQRQWLHCDGGHEWSEQ